MKLLVVGPQGSGKSTQANLISKKLNVPVISTGEIFRTLREEDSILGQKVRQIYDEGRLVDDETTAEIVKKRLGDANFKNGFILDGYPRNMQQVKLFDPDFDKVFYFNVSETQVVDRLIKRGRFDDTINLIKRRLEIYYKETEPILEYFMDKNILVEIDGSRSIEEVWGSVESQLG